MQQIFTIFVAIAVSQTDLSAEQEDLWSSKIRVGSAKADRWLRRGTEVVLTKNDRCAARERERKSLSNNVYCHLKQASLSLWLL